MSPARAAFAAFVILGAAGCGGGNDDPGPSGPSRECRASPLANYCLDRPCTDYDAAAQATREYAQSHARFCFAQIGTCGGFRYTFTGTGFTGTYQYFDRAGKLVAVETFTDAIDPRNACFGSTFYGAVARCDRTTTEDVCRSPSSLSSPLGSLERAPITLQP